MNPTTFHKKAIDFLNDYIKTETEKYPFSNKMWDDPKAINITITWSVKDETGWSFKFQANWFLGDDEMPTHDVHVTASKRKERRTRDAWLAKNEEGNYEVV